MKKQFQQLNEAALVELLRRSASVFTDGGVVYLQGHLGAGKTTTARTLIQAFGYEGRVKSPTYSILEVYELDTLTVAHLDLYRLAEAAELIDLGLEELLDKQPILLLVEWPDHGTGYLPAADLCLMLSVSRDKSGQDCRDLSVEAVSEKGSAILSKWPEPAAIAV